MFTRTAKCIVAQLLLAVIVIVISSSVPVWSHQAARGRSAFPQPPPGKMNVLFIAVDDLRPEGGAFGSTIVKTPSIDRLARTGTVFTRAYCQQAVCSPSRTSLLTGRRPDTTKIYDLQTHFRKTIPDVVTLPQHFRANGYYTQAFGKIFHGGLDDQPSWNMSNQNLGQSGGRNPGKDPSWEAPDVADSELSDGKLADAAVKALGELKGKSFFLAVGFRKPHLPFVAPKKYYDLYPLDKVKLASNPVPPKDAPPVALHNSGELRNWSDIPKGTEPIPETKARELVRAYYAATSYMDAQFGRVLDELDRLGLRDTTIIILWGDHGWQLGEHGMWNKHTNFETSTRAPLVFSVPRLADRGAKLNQLVEFVDIYPTLSELAGLPLPNGLEGTSLVPLMKNPQRQWKRAAFSQYPRGGGNQSPGAAGRVMGYSMRTERYRFTEWLKRDTKERTAVELYDHQSDPDENVNIAVRPASRALVEQLSRQLAAGWQAALPKGVAASKTGSIVPSRASTAHRFF